MTVQFVNKGSVDLFVGKVLLTEPLIYDPFFFALKKQITLKFSLHFPAWK